MMVILRKVAINDDENDNLAMRRELVGDLEVRESTARVYLTDESIELRTKRNKRKIERRHSIQLIVD
jgi:hypothetical protein